MAKEDLFQLLVEKHRHISWYDHHAPSLNGREFLGRFCSRVALASNKCAAKLVALDHAPHDEYSLFLAQIGQVHDFQRGKSHLMPKALQLQDIIASGYDLPTLVQDLASGKAWHTGNLKKKYQVVLTKFNERKIQAYSSLEQSIEHTTIAGFNVAFALSPACLYMKLAPTYLNEKRNMCYGQTDVFVIFYEGIQNVIIQGYNQVGALVPAFCISQQGGGRGHMGGFLLPHFPSAATYTADTLEIKQRLEVFLTHSDAA